MQKKYHDRRPNATDLPELNPGQPVLFLNLADVDTYIEGTITGPSTTPCSYTTEAQGRTYCCYRYHICPIHINTTPISGPSMHQGKPISGSPSTKSHQSDPVKQPKQSCIPTQKFPTPSSYSPTTNHKVNSCQKPTSHIPTPQHKLLPKTSAYMSKPTSQNKYNSSLTRPSTTVHNNPTIPRPSYL